MRKLSAKSRPVLAVDFDGVIMDRDSRCPTPSCRESLLQLNKKYQLICFTARHDIAGVSAWLLNHQMLHLFKDVTNRKPQAVHYVDDKGYHWTSWEQTLLDLYATP